MYRVERFVEKPDEKTAKAFLENGGYAWNAGIFVFHIKTLLEEYKRFAPEMVEVFQRHRNRFQHNGWNEPELIEAIYAEVEKNSIDYLVLDIQAPASALLTEELGILLHLKDELTDIQLRTIDALSLDAMYLEDNAAPLTIQGQMELQRVSGLARTSLLLKVRPDVEQEDLLSLREAGAILVAVDLSERNATDARRRLRGIVDALPPRRPRRKEMPEVTLPRNATSAEAEDDEEE